jgi:ABC-type transporter MlaC component
LYGDVLTYSIWPGAYYDPFWAYGPDVFLSGIYWPGPYYSASSNGQYDGLYDVYGAGAPANVAAPATAQQTASSTSGMTVTCSGLAPGVTGLPIDRIIAQAVQPTGNQIKALDDLESAAARASDVVKASCPNQVPLTPLDRLDAVEKRLDAMIQAVQMVRAPLERFYSSLSDAQKERLSAMSEPANGRSSSGSDVAALCDPRAVSFAQLPVDRIERAIQPTSQQEATFENLKATSASAAASLQASCPAKTPATPVERIDAVEMRLDAMVQAAKDVRPALGAFYATLSDEQKARFNIPMSSANAAAQ